MKFGKWLYYLQSIPRLLTGITPWQRVLAIFLGQAGVGPYFIQLRGSGLRFKTRSAMDIWSIKETCLDRFYERYGAAILPGWTVMDIGGALGDYALFAAQQQPTCRVYTFEPTPESFALLQENMALNPAIRNIEALPLAIWSHAAEIVIDTVLGEASQYISREAGAAVNPSAARVQGVSLGEALERCAIEQCDLLKMDCEGAEFPILLNTPDETLQKIERIVMEYHDNTGEYTHENLETFLNAKGYQVRVYPSPVHDYLGYLYAVRP
jgi:FkbM family methyltransferase